MEPVNDFMLLDEYEMPIAQPIAAGGVSPRQLLHWSAALLATVLVGVGIWQVWPRVAASRPNAALLYIALEHRLVALQASDGGLRWSQNLAGLPLAANATTVTIETADATQVVDAKTGKMHWQANASAYGDPALVQAGIVYSTLGDSQRLAGQPDFLVARTIATGAEVWRVPLPAQADVAIAADAQMVYIGHTTSSRAAPNSPLSAYDLHSGMLQWQTNLPNTAYVFPQVLNQHLYVLAPDAVYALDPSTGRHLWQVTGTPTATPVAYHGAVLLASQSALAAVDATTGTVRWRVALGEALTQAPIVRNGLIVIQTQHTLRVLDAEGTIMWQASGMPQFQGQLLATNDGLYVQDSTGITAYSLTNGLWRWHVMSGQLAGPSSTVVGNTLYATRGATVYAIDLRTGQMRWHRTLDGPALLSVLSSTMDAA